MKKTYMLVMLLLSLLSCGPKVDFASNTKSFSPLSDNVEVVVIETHEESPKNAILVGRIEIGDTGFSVDCGPTKVMDIAKRKARSIGANIIKLHEAQSPDFLSSCFRIRASLYRSSDLK